MSYYIIVYIWEIIALLYFWINIFIRNKWTLFWKFFISSMIFYSIWLISYLIAYTTTYDKDILIIISKTIYWSWLLATYSMLFSIIHFWNKNRKINNYLKLIFLFICIFSITCIFSKLFISDMIYNNETQTYNEVFWFLYSFYYILYLIFLPILTITSYFKIKKLSKIDKIRFKYLSLSYLFFILNETVFLVVLPIFWLWYFQKEHVLFLLPFIFSILYITYKYNFLDVKLLLWKVVNYIFSLFISILILFLLKKYFLSLSPIFSKFWWIDKNFWIFDLILWILIFTITNFLVNKYIIWQSEYYYLSKEITKLKRKIAFINNLSSLNNLLNKEFSKLFKTNYVNIEIFKEKIWDLNWLKEYFLKDKSYKIFINDIVFIEENKNKFNYKKIELEITNKSYLIFRLINNKKDFIWIFKMWPKLFQDWYTQEEVDLLVDFVEFLIWHLKYIEIYSQIHELNVNLDKKIDEKTIEYNNLLNRQNDFISFASHEIKSPLWSCIFQFDCLIDDLKEKNIDDDVLESINELNKKLWKVWDLTKTIFSVQKFDLWKMKLFKQMVDLNFLLEDKIEFHEKSNVNISFVKQIKNNIWEINVDRIQFEQVLDNLINNAIKFCNKNEPKILIKAYKEKENIAIEVEDNWEWLSKEELEKIFDKYSTWESNSIWLWMWLYLCKKIVELHLWNISASIWKNLWWACFKIYIPKGID